MTSRLKATGIALTGRLQPTDLTLEAGEKVALIGPNGGGKSSLLRALAGVERTSGQALVDGCDLDSTGPARRPYLLSLLPASRDVVWPMSVRDVIALGLPIPDDLRVERLAALLELEELLGRSIDSLSTGERARALLARALAPKPQLLLLDEPLSNLDPYWVLRLLEILREVVLEGATAVVALHDIDRITGFDRALLMYNGELRADLPPGKMLESEAFGDAFRIERNASGWNLRTADRRSLQ